MASRLSGCGPVGKEENSEWRCRAIKFKKKCSKWLSWKYGAQQWQLQKKASAGFKCSETSYV